MDVCEVHEDMIPLVKRFLSNRQGFSDNQGWAGLFNYSWKLNGYPYGYALMSGGQIAGFLGTIFSERWVDGAKRICCNTTSWFVEEEYRDQMAALRLFGPILKMNGLVITNLSPTARAQHICEAFGYKALDSEQIAVPMLPGLASLLGLRRKGISFTLEKTEIPAHLTPDELKIFEDHSGLACKHFLIVDRQTAEHCYGIATTTPLGRFRGLGAHWFNLCYLSNPSVFAKSFPWIKSGLWFEWRCIALRYDSRLVPTKLSSLALRRVQIRQYRSKEALPSAIDNIYSELVTFNKY